MCWKGTLRKIGKKQIYVTYVYYLFCVSLILVKIKPDLHKSKNTLQCMRVPFLYIPINHACTTPGNIVVK